MNEDILGGENAAEQDETIKPPERSFWAKYVSGLPYTTINFFSEHNEFTSK